MTTVGIVGLGKIGLPVAANLLERGFTVVGYRRHMTDAFTGLGGRPATSAREVASRCTVLITCLPHGDALLDALTGPDGVTHGAHPGLTVIDLGMHPLDVKESARDALREVGVPMLDCPISGIPPQAVARQAVVFASGDRAGFDACASVLEGLTDKVFYVGEFGAGSGIKSVANLLVAVHVLAAAEAMTLASRAGIDAETLIRVLGPSVAGSAQFAARAPMMAAERFAPPLSSIEQMNESIAIIDRTARRLGSPTPLLDVAKDWFGSAMVGHRDDDVAAIVAMLGERSTAAYPADGDTPSQAPRGGNDGAEP